MTVAKLRLRMLDLQFSSGCFGMCLAFCWPVDFLTLGLVSCIVQSSRVDHLVGHCCLEERNLIMLLALHVFVFILDQFLVAAAAMSPESIIVARTWG